MNTCPSCGAGVAAGDRFCAHCGTPQSISCPSCGHDNPASNRFCPECGTALAGGAAAPAQAASGADPPVASVSERRLVSVLFADLVGFTTLSEHRDPEEVRELLSRYFERCRTLIERYGGTVEKFIGDAVMAVWGTPVAREDDAERSVRAALSLTQAVTLLGEEVGMPELRVRAGVLTGNAAVEVGAEGEGMVLGDTVNTASRLQSIAAPGTVLVDDVTRRASEAAIAYEDAGEHTVKGREQPVRAWTALQVVAGAGGARRGVGLEAPLVGRERELSQVIETFEESANQVRAKRVTVVGEAGTGKSRLLWEYFKYLSGVERLVSWHQGRCLSYGDSVAYWALAEMIRARAGITEEEGTESSRTKLRATIERFVTDERERALIEPRLAHLLGLESRTAPDRADLFSGWRLFLERMSDEAPVVLVFEDLQWADSGLLEFIDYLMDWSAQRPLFLLTLGRPELLEMRPAWTDGSIALESLPDEAMRELLDGLVPGLPDELAGRILDRADGVPLYAVETVRMLLDRGLVTQDGSRYRVTGDVDELAVPETLQALAGARLDGLTATERAVLQDASVFGQSFTPAGVAAASERSIDTVTTTLDGLVAKQVLGYNDDALSAERGQYHFLQALLRTTAYSTLSRRDRKHRHLAAARHLQEAWGEDAPELAEVLAAHFLDAAAAEPDASDAPRIRAAACETLAEAGERALSLALGAEAMRAFDRAAELAEDDAMRARMLDRAGRAALLDADMAQADGRMAAAVELFERLGDSEGAGYAEIALARICFAQDRLGDAIANLRAASARFAAETTGRAEALALQALMHTFENSFDEALASADAALETAEPLEQWPAVVTAFNAIAVVRQRTGRNEESVAFRERALRISLEHELPVEALRTYNNLADSPLQADQFTEALEIVTPGVRLAQARGDRFWEQILTVLVATAQTGLGRWDEAQEVVDRQVAVGGIVSLGLLPVAARIATGRGDEPAAEGLWHAAVEAASNNSEYEWSPLVTRAIVANMRGDHAEALELALTVALTGSETPNEDRREAFAEAGRAALALDDETTVQRLIDHVTAMPPSLRSPLLRAGATRLRANLAQRHGDPASADSEFATAELDLRKIGARFVLAQVLLEHGELFLAQGRDEAAAPLLREAGELFEGLRAAPWLARVRAATDEQRTGAAA